MDQFIGQLQQKMQEFRIGVLRVEDVDEANGKIILTVSEADAAMYQQKKCIRAALRFDSDNKNLSRFPVDFTGTSGEVFLLFLSGKPMLLCQRNSGIPLRQPPMRPWTTKLTLRQILSSSKEAIQKYLER